MAENLGTVRAELALKIKDFLKMVKTATGSVDQMGDDIQESLEAVSDSAETEFKGMRGLAATFGAGLASAGAVVGAQLLSWTQDFKDTQKSMQKFSAQTGITGKELEGFKDKIEGTWLKGYGDDIEEVAGAYSSFQRELSLSADETQNLTDKAFQLRDLFDVEIEDSLRGSTSLIKNFGIDGTEAFDLITGGLQKAGDRAGDLIDTIDEYSLFFSKAGFSAEEMTSLLIAGVENGARNFDVLGDSVKEFQENLTQSGDEAYEMFEAILGNGDEAKRLVDGVRDGTISVKDAFDQTATALSGMDDQIQQNTLGASVFGGLWSEVGAEGVKAMSEATQNTQNFDGALETASKTLEGQGVTMEQVKRQWGQVTQQIGEQLAPILARTLEVASSLILKLLEFAKANPMITKIIAVAGVLLSVLGAIAGAIIAIGAFLPAIMAGIEFLGSVIAGIGAIIATVVGVVGALPLIIGAVIIGLVALIIWKWDEVKAYSIFIWNTIVNFILNIPTLIQNAWITFVAFILQLWENFKVGAMAIWTKLLEFIKSIPSLLYTFFTSTLPMFIGYVIGAFVRMVITVNAKIYEFFTVTIPNVFKSFWNFVVNLFSTYIPQLLIKVAFLVAQAYIKFQQMKAQLIQKAKEILLGVLKWFQQLPSKISSTASRALKATLNLGKSMLKGLNDFKKNFPKLVTDTINNAIKGIGKLGSKAWTALKSIGSNMWNGFKKGLGISSPSYIEEAMFAISDEGEQLNKDLFRQFRGLRRLPQISSLADIAKQGEQARNNNTNNNNTTVQNFNSPLINYENNDANTTRSTYSLYDLITFKKRAMGVGE